MRRTIALVALCGLMLTILQTAPAQAASFPITQGDLSGTATVTSTANTDTEVDKLSGTEGGEYVEVTIECQTTYDNGGNPKKRTKKYTRTRYEPKSKKKLGSTSSTTTDTYNAAGGYTETVSISSVDNLTGETIDTSGTGEFDGDDNRLSGDETTTTRKPGVPPKVDKRKFDPNDPAVPWKRDDSSSVPPLIPIPTSLDTQTSTTADETVYLPDIAGPSSQIVATFDEPNSAGPQDVTVAMIGADGGTKYYRTQTDPDKRVVFSVAAGVTAVLLFKGFDGGKPDAAAARCQIVQNGTVPGTDAIPNPPQTQPAIVRASSAYESGGPSKGTFSIQTRGNDPLSTHLLLDDKPRHIHVLAASDQEVKGRIGNSASLGRHSVSLISGKQKSNAFPTDLVRMRADPLPPSQVGTIQPATVHVEGVPATDPAVMTFAIGGAGELADGGASATVPVANGIAQVRIRGTRTGAALLRYHLHVKIPGFWET